MITMMMMEWMKGMMTWQTWQICGREGQSEHHGSHHRLTASCWEGLKEFVEEVRVELINFEGAEM